MESHESCLAADGRAWKVDGRAQALVGPGLATPLCLYTIARIAATACTDFYHDRAKFLFQIIKSRKNHMYTSV